MRIGIDLMGSDSPPHLLFNAVLQAAEHFDASCTLVVIATKSVVEQLSSFASPSKTSPHAQIRFHEAVDAIAMTDDPMGAIRHKKGSSLVLGIRLLKKRQLEAFVSCGNTGALVAGATLSLSMLPGIKRPALLVNFPTERGIIAILDVGSTVASKASYLVQFAHLGAAYQRAVHGIKVPSLGLLNVGVESGKGTMEVREAYGFLQAHSPEQMNFAGNVEARDVFKGRVDVLVTDGFTGNVLLKTAEGTASFIFDALKNALKDQPSKEFCQAFDELQKQFDYAEYPGALVCGVDGVVVKVHGTGCPKALFNSIMGAADYVRKDVVGHLKRELKRAKEPKDNKDLKDKI